TCAEICAGAGGQALGLEQAGIGHAAAVEIDAGARETLRRNRGSRWKLIEGDVADVDGTEFRGVDLLAGGGRPAVLSCRAPARRGGRA
ncbi:MAG TPA: DNA cytosine methyltransferase, partial [Streptosporangiaceae bacterium]|nr:DNA cytosine methyltransferase [Streptosporangiaceae bacterium]